MKSKEQKRMEAEERQRKYNVLTAEQKITKLDMAGFRAIKERMRLGKQLWKQSKEVMETLAS